MIIATNGGGKKWLNNRVNLSLIFNHTTSSFFSSAPSFITSTAGLFQFLSLPQSNVILLMRAAMVGVRRNIRMATMHDTRMARYSIARLININSLIRLNYIETNPNGLRMFNISDSNVEDISQHVRWTDSIFFHNSQFRIFWWEDLIKLGKLLQLSQDWSSAGIYRGVI